MDPINNAINRACTTIKSVISDPLISKSNFKDLNKILQEAFLGLQQCREKPNNKLMGVSPQEEMPQVIDDRKQRAINILQNIDYQFDKVNPHLNKNKAAAIHAKLKTAKELIATTKPQAITHSQTEIPKIDMSIAFLCDADISDHNGAIESNLVEMFLNKIPFVTSRSVLCSTRDGGDANIRFQAEEHLLNGAADWSIYQQHSQNGEGFLVFLPKSSSEGEESKELLRSYDFNADQLEKINVAEALVPSERKNHFESFTELFSTNPTKSKLFFIAGHGNEKRTAGLTTPHYEKLTQFLGKQNCQGLIVASCYAGGESTLMHTEKAKATHEEQVQADYRGTTPDNQPLKFPVIMRSIGNYTTTIDPGAPDTNFQAYFSNITSFLESDRAKTAAGLRPAVRESEGLSDYDKHDLNLAQVYYPSGADSPGGFQTVGEKKDYSYSLTFHRLQSEKLLGSKLGIDSLPIVVNHKLLEVHPLVVDATLVFKSNPTLLSMIPGQAHHYIHEIQLEQGSIGGLLKNTMNFGAEGLLNVSKGFYISKLSSAEGEVWDQVALKFNGGNLSCYYCKEGTYYHWDGTDAPAEPISQCQYAFALEEWAAGTTPRDSAVRSQTGGQQDHKLFDEALENNEVIAFTRSLFKPEKIAQKEVEIEAELRKSDGTIEKQEVSAKLVNHLLKDITSPKDQETVAFYLLSCGKADLTQAVMLYKNLPANITDRNGSPIIVSAAAAGATDFVLHLLDQGALPDSKDPDTNNSLLHIAVAEHNISLMEALLSKGLDIEVQNARGCSPLFSMLQHDDIDVFLKLKESGANINTLAGNNNSLLSLALRMSTAGLNDRSIFFKLLDEGIDPNVGDPSPLYYAIMNSDSEAIEKLIEKGAEIKNNFSGGKKPMILEAMERCSPSVVEKLFKLPGFDPAIADESGMTPLILAVRLGNRGYVDALLAKGAKMASYDNASMGLEINKGLKRMEASGDYGIVEAILRQGAPVEFERAVIDQLNAKHPKLIKSWMDQGFIKQPIFIQQAAGY